MVRCEIKRVSTTHYTIYENDIYIADLIRDKEDRDFNLWIKQNCMYINQETIKHLSTFINFKESLAGQETDKVLNKSLENNPSGSGKDE